MKLVSVQPFGVRDPGGGPRIMRALLSEPLIETLAVCTAVAGPAPGSPVPERSVPTRPWLARLEATRVNRGLGLVELAYRRRFARRIAELLRTEDAVAVHAVAHGADFVTADREADRLGLPFFLTVHDDLGWLLRGHPDRRYLVRCLGQAWRRATHCFVISAQMGEAMVQSHGVRTFTTVTDGLLATAECPRPSRPGRLHVYFMGAFHLTYRSNLESLVRAMAQYREATGADVKLIMRCGQLPPMDLDPSVPLEWLPFGGEQVVMQDMARADALYLPLPFGSEHRRFVALSLSTKLVTYLGTGLPILLHGPSDAGAAALLVPRGAAVSVTALDPAAVVRGLFELDERREQTARAALQLAREQFLIGDIRARFWAPILKATGVSDLAPGDRPEQGAPSALRQAGSCER